MQGQQSRLSEQLTAFGSIVADISENPEARPRLRSELRNIAYVLKEGLSDEDRREIEALELKFLLPEILKRLN